MIEFLKTVFYNSSFSFLSQLYAAELILFFGKKRRKLGMLCFALGFISTVAVAVFWKSTALTDSLSLFLSVIRYLTLFIGSIITFAFTFECSAIEIAFYSIFGYTMQHLAASIGWLIGLGCFQEWVLAKFLRLQYITTAVCVIEYTALYFTLVKRIKKHDIKLETLNLIIPSVIILLVSVIMNLVVLEHRLSDPIIEIYPIALCFIALLLLSGLFKNSKLSEEKLYIEYILKQQKNNSEISRESINVINIKCHDMKKQLETIEKINSTEQLAEYKREIVNSIDNYDLVADTGNEALDVVISERAIFCKSRGIKLNYMADGKLLSFMSVADTYSLFANALDNAIEALAGVEDGKRVIDMRVAKERQMIIVSVENYFDENVGLQFVDGLPMTVKEDKIKHGFGVKSIKLIAEKYGGTVTIGAQNDVFDLNIMFRTQ